MKVSKVVMIDTSESSFIYLDRLKDGSFRIAYTPDNAEDVRKLRESEVVEKGTEEMDIGSGTKYPAGALSNFSPHPFEIDGVKCNSMEGWLQSLKFESVEMQEHVCTLVGIKAKSKGRKKKWFKTQTLYWKGTPIKRDSEEYQQLLDRAYDALAENTKFRKALLASGDAVLKHSIGKKNINETVLTRREFCSRLTAIRERLKNAEEQ